MDQETKNSIMPHQFSLPSLKTSGNNLASWDTENEAGSDTKNVLPADQFSQCQKSQCMLLQEKSHNGISVSSHMLQFWPAK